MSARQSSSLSRVGRLRAGLVVTLRRSFPEIAERAEREMGRRLAEVDDEVLLTFIDNLTASAVRNEEKTALLAIGTALKECGFKINLNENPSNWVTEIRESVSEKKPSETLNVQLSKKSVEANSGPRSQANNAAENSHEVDSTAKQLITSPTFAELYGDTNITIADSSKSEDKNVQNKKIENVPVEPLAQANSDWPDDVVQELNKDSMLENYIDNSQSNSTTANNDSQNITPATLSDLFGAELWPGTLGDPKDSSNGWSPSPIKASNTAIKRNAAPAAVPPPLPNSSATEPPLRPELFPSQQKIKGSKKGRPVRVTAEAPSPYGTQEQSLILDDSLRQALIAASAIPRPVFTRDLVSIAGSPDIIDAWEDECRAAPDTNPVRFIAPKQRHRMRGSLVVPDESIRAGKYREDDWWHRCVELYRAARLYEMGVLLHRVGDELVSAKFTQHNALLRLNSARGLVGIVVTTDDRIEQGELARADLASSIGELMRERLTLVAVLTSAGEEREMERLIKTVLDLSRESGWNPSFPVVAARSWEYADDRGSTSRLIIGG